MASAMAHTTITVTGISETSYSDPNYHSLKRNYETYNRIESESRTVQEKRIQDYEQQRTSDFPVQAYTGISIEGKYPL
jgi:hypothetical protein